MYRLKYIGALINNNAHKWFPCNLYCVEMVEGGEIHGGIKQNEPMKSVPCECGGQMFLSCHNSNAKGDNQIKDNNIP
jgi:hypothetical protein